MTSLNFKYLPLALIVIIAVSLRLYRVSNPPMDWHAHRQSDTASVSHQFLVHGTDLLKPTYHDLSNIQSGQPNLDGYRMVEFPIINAVAAETTRLLPGSHLDTVSRVFSIIFSAATLVVLFLFVQHISGTKLAYMTAITFAILPYSVFYGRVILPEPSMLFFSTFAMFAFYRWLKTMAVGWYLSSALALALALLLKPFVAFLGPVFLALMYVQWGNDWKKLARSTLRPRDIAWKKISLLVLFGFLAFAPLMGWRWWISQFPSGIPANDWLLNGNGIRFRPAWVRWLGFERITKLLLGFTGLIFLLCSFFRRSKHKLVYWAWWLSIGLYFTVVATGNVQHDYYQVLALPILCISVAEGVLFLFDRLRKFLHPTFDTFLGTNRAHEAAAEVLSGTFVVALYCSMLFLSWLQVGGYFNVNHWEYVKAGQAVQAETAPDAKVIAPAMGDTQFLYQTKRQGWPIGYSLDEKIEQGATHYVTTSYDDEARELEAEYFVIKKTDDYLIIDLTKQKNE